MYELINYEPHLAKVISDATWQSLPYYSKERYRKKEEETITETIVEQVIDTGIDILATMAISSLLSDDSPSISSGSNDPSFSGFGGGSFGGGGADGSW